MAKRIYSDPGKFTEAEQLFSAEHFLFTRPRKVPLRMRGNSSFVFDGLAMMICLKGEGTINVNYRTVKIRENQIVIVLPYQIVSGIRHSQDAFVAGLFIGRNYLSSSPVVNPDFDRLVQLGIKPVITFTQQEMDRLMELHSVILTRYTNLNDPYTEECIQGLMFAFLAEIGCVYRKNESNLIKLTPTRQERITDEFFRLLIHNFREHRSVAFYAEKLCFTPKYLSAVVKRVTGHTIQDWINEIVINHVKNLLRTTDKTVLEISEEMNFSNPSFFGRFFKQYAGMTPQQFRFS